MPEIPQYVPRGKPIVPGTPRIPVGLSQAYSGVAAGLGATATDLGRLSSIEGYQESAVEEAEAVNLAESALTAFAQDLHAKARELRDPGQGPEDYRAFQPRARRDAFVAFAQDRMTFYGETLQKSNPLAYGRWLGRVRTIAEPMVDAFWKEMETAHREKDNLLLTENVKHLVIEGVNAVTDEHARSVLDRLHNLYAARVQANLLPAREAAAMEKAARVEIFKGRYGERVLRNPHLWLGWRHGVLDPETVGMAETIFGREIERLPVEVKEHLDAMARTAIEDRERSAQRQQRLAEEVRKETEEKNMVELERRILTVGPDQITTDRALLEFVEAHPVGSVNLTKARHLMAQARQAPSDPLVLADLHVRASSLNPARTPTRDEVYGHILAGNIGVTDAVPLLGQIRERELFFRTESLTAYDKEAAEAEHRLGGLLQMTLPYLATLPEAQLAQQLALKQLNERVLQARGQPNQHPLDWIGEIYQRAVVSLAESGRFMVDMEVARRTLPPGWRHVDSLINLRRENKITHRQFIDTLTLLNTIELVERITQRPVSTSTTDTGRPR